MVSLGLRLDDASSNEMVHKELSFLTATAKFHQRVYRSLKNAFSLYGDIRVRNFRSPGDDTDAPECLLKFVELNRRQLRVTAFRRVQKLAAELGQMLSCVH
jgi:hypothetical protein